MDARKGTPKSKQKTVKKKAGKKKSKVYTTTPPVKYVKQPNLSLNSNILPPQQTIGITQLTRTQSMQLSQIWVGCATFFSRLMSMGTQNLDVGYEDSYNFLARGIATMVATGIDMAQGNPNLASLPWIWEVVFSLLQPKTARMLHGTLKYTANFDDHNELPWVITTPLNAVYTFGSAAAATTPFVPLPTGNVTNLNPTNYSQFLAMCQNHQGRGFKIVDINKVKKRQYHSDPSAFARTYSYFGVSGPGNGMYSNAELEVPFLYPLFSKFVPYDLNDEVVSRFFLPQSGGLNTVVGLSITVKEEHFDYPQLKNPIPVIYKCLDFMEFVDLVQAWLIGVYNYNAGVINQATAANTLQTIQPLPFSQYEFIWMLRQAVLSVFPEQCHAQFVAPTNEQSTNVVFQPLIIDGIVYPAPQFNTVKLPTFIVENLCMLRQIAIPVETTARSRKYGTKPKKLYNITTPVWGYYTQAIPAVPTYVPFGSDVKVPIFQGANDSRLERFYDGIYNNSKYNVNASLDEVVATWNGFVSTFGQQVSSVSSMSVDRDPGVTLLKYTRVKGRRENDSTRMATYKNPFNQFWMNYDPSYDAKKKVIPPATNAELCTLILMSIHEFSTDTASALSQLFLPFVRFENVASASTDYLTRSNLVPYVMETSALQTPIQQIGTVPSELERLTNAALAISHNKATHTGTGDALTSAIEFVNKSGLGSDILKALLGNLAGMIPVVGPALAGLLT